MQYKVRKGYIFHHPKIGDRYFKEGEIIDDKVIPVEGQEWKLEAIKLKKAMKPIEPNTVKKQLEHVEQKEPEKKQEVQGENQTTRIPSGKEPNDRQRSSKTQEN